RNLKSVEVARGGFLVIGSEEPGAELVIVTLDADARVSAVKTFALPGSFRDHDVERSYNSLHISPDGGTIAANVANHRVQFYRLSLDAAGMPIGVSALGAPSDDLGRRLSVGKWTPDGHFLLISDTNGGGKGVAMLMQGPSTLTVLKPPADASGAPAVV